MNYNEMFERLDAAFPDVLGESPTYEHQPQYVDQPITWEEDFSAYKTRPVLYNMEGWISPYSSNNWGGTSNILQYIDDQSRIPAVENKIDPNKIFSSEINGLRALAADQQKIVKMFEKRFMESLSEKGKIGLTEEDIEAMSALTAARSAITNISKEQVNIKKNIADIRIKQNQSGSGTKGGEMGSKPMDVMSQGRLMLDSVFDSPAANISLRTQQIPAQQGSTQEVIVQQPPTPTVYQGASMADPGRVLDELVPSVGSHVTFEGKEPTTYVLLGETDDDIEFVTYSSDGEIIPDYPTPDANITSIDRGANLATDQYLVSYPIKYK